MTEKKTALITGANRGLGLETARQLGKKGITVIVAARDIAAAEKTAGELAGSGIDAIPLQLDVTNAAHRQAAAAYINTRFGQLDILINNAGVAPKEGTLFGIMAAGTTQEEFEYVFNVNFFSIVELTNELLPLLKKSPAGRIVNLSSILGSLTIHSQPDSPYAGVKRLSYNASKTALNVFTNHLAAELAGTRIKVNSANPGWVQTDMGGADAPLAIEEGAKTSVALALLPEDGPTGKFFHLDKELPW